MLRTLILCGDFWHAPAPFVPNLKRALGEHTEGLTAHLFPSAFDTAELEHTDLLVLCKESIVPGTHKTDREANWISLEQERTILDWVAQGGTLLAWHSGAAGYSPEGLQQVFGGQFRGHPPIHSFAVKVTKPGHPLATGVTDFSVIDELYHFSVKDSDEFEVFIEGVSEEHGITEPIAWTHSHGKGDVIVYLLGHLPPTLGQPASQALMKNIVARAVSHQR
ncbi:MAG: ThuA domain-containing protein [Opitutales bacterium]